MNQPSRTDDALDHPGWNQNPPPLNADATTRNDFNGIVNLRDRRNHSLQTTTSPDGVARIEVVPPNPNETVPSKAAVETSQKGVLATTMSTPQTRSKALTISVSVPSFLRPIVKFASFIGPGFLIAVAYIDPGNYATDAAAGAESKYALLFVVLMSNLFAVFLQSLCIKLGSVTGLNLAENCRAHLPKWLNICLYILSEAAIIATDIAEVIGSAIALNLLLKIPLVAGCVITMADVLILLIFYRPQGSMWGLRAFEIFVMLLVLGVVVCFCIQLSLLKAQSVGEVFRGYLPSAAVVESKGLYQSCGILGATVMPHSLFLGSGSVQPRLKEYDIDAGYIEPSGQGEVYRPSIHAIRGCLKYSIIELSLSLFTFALFINSAILIVAAAALYGTPGADNADLFGIHDLLSQSIAPAAGTIFGLALLLSGLSAGIVCTIAGQMISEGMINWSCRPWIRRLLTRVISIVPSVIIAASVGREGLDTALTASQVVLSVILPFVVAPLIYFTARNKFMTVRSEAVDLSQTSTEAQALAEAAVKMRNGWPVSALAGVIWVAITIMDVALLVLIGMGLA
ncbi:transporter protein smf2 [Talaromyces stipitatus ATCC 10500]|uniref:Transporter protein smf2 n=1 Tax=Talaromyces stipitatus (strain ATCC 10500 / CBS 375.48 / QM 6759 / NRRL 1006) TaxID=441959 RepID=B8LWJ9_TALSN|nr:transporter protein smf2 [Talaromyces stipitatus ATCC 10500]EED24396.1 transporter protein smf2 [Talaromyces stipitatus ATCC 10500]